ncbi:MAG: Ig-like domain-containing protein [Armatimonadota bacterium]
MSAEPLEERLSEAIDSINENRAAVPADDEELRTLVETAGTVKTALSTPVMPDSMEQRIWERVSRSIKCEAEGRSKRARTVSVWRRRYAFVGVALLLGAVGASASFVQKLIVGASVPSYAVRIGAPKNGAAVSGAVEIKIEAAGKSVPSRTEVFVDGRRLGVLRRLPGSVKWNTRQTSNGPHVLSALASTNKGEVWATSVAVAVVNKEEEPGRLGGVVSTSGGKPASGAVVEIAGPERRTAAADADGAFEIEGLAPGKYLATALLGSGRSRTVQVRVYPGRRTEVLLEIDASKSRPAAGPGPSGARRKRLDVRLMFPFDGALVHGVVPVVWESASAHKGLVKVEVFLDGKRLFSAERPPYRWVWNTEEASDGEHEMVFVVTCTECGQHRYRVGVVVANDTFGGLVGADAEASGETPKRVRFWVNAPPNP